MLPAIDVRGGRCVRLIQGDARRERVYGADPAAAARRWESEGAAWLHVVDLDGALTGAQVNAEAIRRLIRAVGIPVQVGGGMRDLATIEAWLAGGAARVILGTAALSDGALLAEACRRFPGRVAVSIDARDGQVRVEGWVAGTGTHAPAAAARMAAAGVPRLVYTDIGPDGTLGGPDVEGIRGVLEAAGVPVIVAGGIAAVEHVRRLRPLVALGLEGVIVGRALYEGRVRLPDLLGAAA